MDTSRRTLLKALGLLGPAYFLPSLLSGGDRKARAGNPAIPTRIVFFYTPHGTLFQQWVVPPAGAKVATETSYALGPILQPLQSFDANKKLLLVQGLDMKSQYKDPSMPAGHNGGQTHALSATSRNDATTAGGISIDQFIANTINAPTLLPSLQMSARMNAGIAPYVTSWSGPGNVIAPYTTPQPVFNALFPNGPPSAAPVTSAAQMAAAALAARKKSILDSVLGEFKAIQQPLAAADKMRLDQHAQLIQQLETKLMVSQMPPSAACFAPTSADYTAAVASFGNGGACQYGADGDVDTCRGGAASAFIDLAVAALACDLTRVITIDVDQPPDSNFSDNPAVAAAGGIHGFLHGMDDVFWFGSQHYPASKVVGAPPPPTAMASDPTNMATAAKHYASFATMLGNLLTQLDALKESDGSSVLDHTLVVWCGELGSPNHLCFMMNYVIAGGGATGFVDGGRFVDMPRTDVTASEVSSGDYYINTGVPHNNLFVSLANAMGAADVTTFPPTLPAGAPVVCTGNFPQLKKS